MDAYTGIIGLIDQRRKVLIACLALLVGGLILLSPAPGKGAKQDRMYKTCLECHPDVGKQLTSTHVHKPFKDMDCSSCHNPHTTEYEGLIKKPVQELCKQCHEVESEMDKTIYSHFPYQQGDCKSCHSPHGSSYKGLLTTSEGELCYNCHKKESFAFKNTHTPVKKGDCLSCHEPHVSADPLLLAKDKTELCQGCHKTGPGLTAAHEGFSVKGADCESCHNPHGADRKALVKAFMHKPFDDGRCAECHEGKRKDSGPGLNDESSGLCLKCHEDTRNDFMKINSHIGPGNFCVNCHSPHASDQDSLKKSKETYVCLSCHKDTRHLVRGKEKEYRHPLVKEGKCSSCHQAHGSNYRLMYPDSEIVLCVSCHQRHQTFTHPIGADAIDPRTKRDITCITCHILMGSPYKYALRGDREQELCLQCHEDY